MINFQVVKPGTEDEYCFHVYDTQEEYLEASRKRSCLLELSEPDPASVSWTHRFERDGNVKVCAFIAPDGLRVGEICTLCHSALMDMIPKEEFPLRDFDEFGYNLGCLVNGFWEAYEISKKHKKAKNN